MIFRLKRVGLVFAVIITAGLAYFLVCDKIGFGIPCMFYKITGFKCPGCGVSRMCISLLKGDIYSAWLYNRGIMLMLPFIAYLIIREVYLYIRYGDCTLKKWESVLAIIIVVILLVFCLARNFCGW